MKLTIELVPQTCFYSNVRSEVSRAEWDVIRKATYNKANYRCEICDGRGTKHPVECHEVWEYDEENQIQKLIRMIALCPSCHEVKHIGLATIRGRRVETTEHLMKINSINREEAERYIVECSNKWQERSQYDWTLDVEHLKTLKENEWLN